MRRWTEEEKQYLSENYNGRNLAACSRKLNRTECAVKQMVKHLGLAVLAKGEKHPWALYSDHDIALARALDKEGLSKDLISQKLEMGISTVRYYVRNPDKRPTQALA